MRNYLVLYKENPEVVRSLNYGHEQAFKCQADDREHAIEQCQNSEDEAIILMVYVEC